MDSPYKHNKPTAPPPPKSAENPPDYASATSKSQTVVHTLIEGACGGMADTVVTKTVTDHSNSNSSDIGWTKYKDDINGSDNEDDNTQVTEKNYKKPNTIVNEKQNDKFVKLTMKIPGLKVKYITHAPRNGRIISKEYKRNKVSLTFVLNEDHDDKKQIYKYENREPFKMNIQEEGSYFKFAEDTVKWRIKKA